MDIYTKSPVAETEHFTLRLIRQEDSVNLFQCYHDKQAVALMNDDNCDFGFYTETEAQMAASLTYWLEAYEKRWFVRFAIVDRITADAVGTIEGFDGEVGVLRVDIASAYEQEAYLQELLAFARDNFRDYFGNRRLVTKAVPPAVQRRNALETGGWTYIDTFREYRDYYSISL